MRVNGPDLREFRARRGEERVFHRQEILPDHRDLALCEGIVTVRHAARRRILDWDDGVIALALIDRAHCRVKALDMRKARLLIVPKDLYGGEVAVSALQALVYNVFRVREPQNAPIAVDRAVHARRFSSSTSISRMRSAV